MSKETNTAQVLSLLLLCECGQVIDCVACYVLNTICFLHWKEFNSQRHTWLLKEQKVAGRVGTRLLS